MNDELTPPSNEEPAAATETLGQLLRAAREASGMSIADLAAALHLRPAIVKDLEADDFSNIASPTYIRGYVRNFARIVNADKHKVDLYLATQVPDVSQPAMQSFSRKTVREAHDNRYLMVTYIVLAVLFGLLVFWWLQNSSYFNETGIDFSQPTAEEVAASESLIPQPHTLPAQDSNASGEVSPSTLGGGSTDANLASPDPVANSETAAGATGDNLSAQASSTVPGQGQSQLSDAGVTDSVNPSQIAEQSQTGGDVAQGERQPTTEGLSTLELSFSEECWVQVKDGNDKVLVSELHQAGDLVSLEGIEPFKLVLGVPRAVAVHFNGHPISLAEFSDRKVARFRLPKQ